MFWNFVFSFGHFWARFPRCYRYFFGGVPPPWGGSDPPLFELLCTPPSKKNTPPWRGGYPPKIISDVGEHLQDPVFLKKNSKTLTPDRSKILETQFSKNDLNQKNFKVLGMGFFQKNDNFIFFELFHFF